MKRLFGFLLLGSVVFSVACATSGPPLSRDVTDTHRRAYYEGMRLLKKRDFTKSSKIFEALAAAPSRIKYSLLAQVRLGDTLFFQGRYLEAAGVYQRFADRHAADPNIPYARYKVAEAYYKRLPTAWFVTPPAHEFDQQITLRAQAELQRFLGAFPTSEFAPSARKMLHETRQMLYRHERYAIDFYESREKWQAVAWRLDALIKNFPEFARDDETLWSRARAWDAVRVQAEGPAPEKAAEETLRAVEFYLKNQPEGKYQREAATLRSALRPAEPAPSGGVSPGASLE